MDKVAHFETHGAYFEAIHRVDIVAIYREEGEGARTISGTETFPAISCRASFYRRPMLFERNPVVRIMAGEGRGNSSSRANLSRSLLRRFIYTPPPDDLYETKERGNIFLAVRMVGCVIAAPSIVETTWSGWGFRGKVGNGIGGEVKRRLDRSWLFGEKKDWIWTGHDFGGSFNGNDMISMIVNRWGRWRKFLVKREKSVWSNVSLVVTRMDH